MPVTIKINGTNLSLAHKFNNGLSTATIPDVCKTPSPGGPVPIPYPNIAQAITLSSGTTSVKGDKTMTGVKGSKLALSNGDNAGVAGGVKSSTFMKEATWILYSFTVKFQKKNVARFTDKMFHNSKNAANLSGFITIPVKDAQFEGFLQDCVDQASDNWNKANNGPPNAAYCANRRRARARGDKIGEDAGKCVQDKMTQAGRGNEVTIDQPFSRNPAGQLVALASRFVKHVRPDVVLHAAGAVTPGGVVTGAIKAVYDFKAPCPPNTNMPSWSGSQGADYLSIMRVVPQLVSPGLPIVTGAFARVGVASASAGALTQGAKALLKAMRLFRIKPF